MGMGGSWRSTSLGARLSVTGLREGSRPHVGDVGSQKPIISTVLPLNMPRLSWNVCRQLAAANLLTPTHAFSKTHQPCAGPGLSVGPPRSPPDMSEECKTLFGRIFPTKEFNYLAGLCQWII